MLKDYKLGLRMLLKYPGLTIAGGLALAISIGVGAGWYDLSGKIMAPAIPLPEGDRLVLIETQNVLTNEPEPHVLNDFLDWRRELKTVDDLGAYRTDVRNLVVAGAAPEPIEVAELTAAAFHSARVPPLLGRPLNDSDDTPGAASVVVLGYEVWQRLLGARHDVIGSIVTLGSTSATVVGVMPDGFTYPINHDAWTPLRLRGSYEPLEGSAISVIGRLAPGVSREEANAELRVFGARTAAAFPATHEHLRPSVRRIAEQPAPDIAQFLLQNLPVLLVLMIACLSVGTLVYARTATREGEIAVRSALGAGRARIIGQLFMEALVLASLAAAIGLIAADRALTWGIEAANRSSGGAPFWMTPGLSLSTMLYACGLAVISAAMLSLLPALRATRARVQSHLARTTGGATLRFGRVWTGAMIVQVALTAIGIPVAMETAHEARLKANIRAAFPGRDYLSARIDLERPLDEEATSSNARRAQPLALLAQRIAEEPGVVTVTFANSAPGSLVRERLAEVLPTGGQMYNHSFRTSEVEPGFFEALDRPIVAGRAFTRGDTSSNTRSVIVNEAFARQFVRESRGASPLGARLRYPLDASTDWYEIVGIVRDIGLAPDDSGNELPYVFHARSAGAVSPLVMTVRMRSNPAALAARLPIVAATVDPRFVVKDAQPLSAWIRQGDDGLTMQAGALTAVTLLVLFLSALGIFSLVTVSVSRRTREIGLRTALGANPRHVLAGVVTHATLLMGTGITAGGAIVLLALALGLGPSGRPVEDMTLFTLYIGVTSAVMVAAGLLACVAPATRALRINPTEALREF